MAERRVGRRLLQVHLDYVFDRLREYKLTQAYDILAPERQRIVAGTKGGTHVKMTAI